MEVCLCNWVEQDSFCKTSRPFHVFVFFVGLDGALGGWCILEVSIFCGLASYNVFMEAVCKQPKVHQFFMIVINMVQVFNYFGWAIEISTIFPLPYTSYNLAVAIQALAQIFYCNSLIGQICLQMMLHGCWYSRETVAA